MNNENSADEIKQPEQGQDTIPKPDNGPEVTVTDATQDTKPEVQDTKPTDDNKADGTPDFSKMNELQKRQWIKKELKDSEIKNQFGYTKLIVLNEGTEHQFHLELRFPGTQIAQSIEDDATGANGQILFADLMQGVYDNNVIAFPTITSSHFWDNHKGFGEACGKILNFLNDGINGQLI